MIDEQTQYKFPETKCRAAGLDANAVKQTADTTGNQNPGMCL